MEKGFSLIELMIVLAIVSILVTVAYPSYTQYLVSARRTDAQGALMDLAARMEQFYAEHNTYAGATIAEDPKTDVLAAAETPEGWYRLELVTSPTTFQLSAVPIRAQLAQDQGCATLTLNQLGLKGNTGKAKTETCWR